MPLRRIRPPLEQVTAQSGSQNPSRTYGRSIGDVKNAFRRAVRLSGIKPLTFHQLRHTFCSRLAEGGILMPVIQDLAGHASITMTRRYTHPSEESKQRAVEMLLRGQTTVLAATKSATSPAETSGNQTRETATEGRSVA